MDRNLNRFRARYLAALSFPSIRDIFRKYSEGRDAISK
jgi:hypothetical protein